MRIRPEDYLLEELEEWLSKRKIKRIEVNFPKVELPKTFTTNERYWREWIRKKRMFEEYWKIKVVECQNVGVVEGK